MMGDWNSWGWGWGMGLGWIFMILLWALIVLGVVGLAKWIFSSATSGHSTPTALDILKERYARGEISREQYEQMRRDIAS